MMTQQIIVALVLLLFSQSISKTFPEQLANGCDVSLAEKIKAAKTCNVYVHFKKGEDAHCLYDPIAENAVAITIFQDRKLDEVKLCIPGTDSVLKDSAVHNFKIGKVDFYAIHKNDKVIIANTSTGQTGVICLAACIATTISPVWRQLKVPVSELG